MTIKNRIDKAEKKHSDRNKEPVTITPVWPDADAPRVSYADWLKTKQPGEQRLFWPEELETR